MERDSFVELREFDGRRIGVTVDEEDVRMRATDCTDYTDGWMMNGEMRDADGICGRPTAMTTAQSKKGMRALQGYDFSWVANFFAFFQHFSPPFKVISCLLLICCENSGGKWCALGSKAVAIWILGLEMKDLDITLIAAEVQK